ncbi:MAG: ribosomal RNA small subunit methyltransferase A [Candidatus Omnitrophica bacterium]|nr:ribosomal RNA small subunit methyltransferase A [Candidatus Omnitrophota bacterium]
MRIYPKKRLGQNFLTDRHIIKKIIQSLELTPSDIILEIGSGKGQITSLIASLVDKVYAVELDRNLLQELSFALKENKNVKIINEDILKIEPKVFLNGKDKIKVFGNIPYYISTPVLEFIIKNREIIDRAFITVQKEFARRVVGSPGSKEYGALSLFIQYYASCRILFNIDKGCFFPKPKVDSSFLCLKLRDNPLAAVKDEELLFKLIRTSFNQRRKALRNSLKGMLDKEEIQEFLIKRKKSLNSRPEELSLEDFTALSGLLA